MRTLAIGDIHGCLTALQTLLDLIKLTPTDQVITVGDYIDRGPDSKGVLDLLIKLNLTGQLMPLRGNHEMMMLAARSSTQDARFWLGCGGVEALKSYSTPEKSATIKDIPENHWHFLRHVCGDFCETETHIFVHANLEPHTPLADQLSEFLHWEFLSEAKHEAHVSGKTMICGHSEQRGGEPLNLGSAICIDTWAYGGKWLTCLDVNSGDYWQANEKGETRRGML